LAVNVPISPDIATAAAIAVGNTAAPLLAAAALRRLGFRRDLARLRDAFMLIVVALCAMIVSASIGTAALSLSGGLHGTSAGDTWWVWWTGDAFGVLIVAPFLWALWPVRVAAVRWQRAVEALVLFGLLTITTVVVTTSSVTRLFVVFPILAWIAWR